MGCGQEKSKFSFDGEDRFLDGAGLQAPQAVLVVDRIGKTDPWLDAKKRGVCCLGPRGDRTPRDGVGMVKTEAQAGVPGLVIKPDGLRAFKQMHAVDQIPIG